MCLCTYSHEIGSVRGEDGTDPLQTDETALCVLVDAPRQLLHERHDDVERQLTHRVADHSRVTAVQHALSYTVCKRHYDHGKQRSRADSKEVSKLALNYVFL